MKALGKLITILLGTLHCSQAAATDPLEVTPSGMTRCMEDIPCIRLSIKNNGNLPISFGADGYLKPTVPLPGIRYFSYSDGNWIEFGQVIGTFMAPRRIITIRPGRVTRLYMSITDMPINAKALRVSVQDKNGTFHYSSPFDPTGRAISATD